ncbi:DNA-3-methyladenine glycosylase I [Kineosporia sp. NBRC 101731]|uniref:DNA-3-methyladenine glycosylase I n=1 Tax=Kineosporia sp. NBRC 101731 TaxID=3032199 RepID=UPI0024A014B1|nr:DNA-3-methyladenine glycosylase I [Kineosporia sp. NBRC 101731]GLY28532.1 DNA-3-methyladenine glycosylase I [Kineosporia sp. NBRC 101731]
MGETRAALVLGDDGLKRCSWGTSSADYRAYHDEEWGRAVHGESRLFERVTLEAFQSGLAWITILRKRENFRAAFSAFDPEKVAAFGEDDVTRLMGDAGIVRNRAKITAAIRNARAVLEVRETVEGGLDALIWSFAPARPARAPRVPGDVMATTPESTALAKALKKHGFAFVGPTTAYAAMQACGLVNDHFAGCHARARSGGDGVVKKSAPVAVGRRG